MASPTSPWSQSSWLPVCGQSRADLHASHRVSVLTCPDSPRVDKGAHLCFFQLRCHPGWEAVGSAGTPVSDTGQNPCMCNQVISKKCQDHFMQKSTVFQQILVEPLQEDEVGHLIYTKYKSHLKMNSRTKCRNENYKMNEWKSLSHVSLWPHGM